MWRKRPALRHPATDWVTTLPAGRARLAHWGGAVLRTLALLLVILALAGPRWPDLRTRINTEGIALVMLVDVSGSMAEPDFDWHGTSISRLEAVKRVFRLFVAGGATADPTPDGTPVSAFEGRPTDQIGLVTFATRPECVCPLTLSHSVLLKLLDAEQPRQIPGESETNLSDAVALGLHRLRSAGPRRKVLVLLTDGEHNVANPRSGWTPRQAAQVAASLEVPIYAIDAGSDRAVVSEPGVPEGSAPTAATRAEAVHTLEELARISHGRYFSARDTASLVAACRTIDRLERSEIPSFQYRRYHQGYPGLGLTAFLLYLLALVLEMTVWRRVP
jgi:Ca-activated chloride channel family protein